MAICCGFRRIARCRSSPPINGHCLAGGMGLLALADIAVAVESAKFGLPEVKIGLFPMQVMSLLGRLVAPRMLREWALTGEPFGAEAARAAGLVNHVVPRRRIGGEGRGAVGGAGGALADRDPARQICAEGPRRHEFRAGHRLRRGAAWTC